MTDPADTPRGRPPGRQGGAVLLVTLIALFTLSVLGISTMRDSTMERRMAENAVQASTVLQLAESASEFAFADAARLHGAFALNGAALALEPRVGPAETTRTEARLSFVGEGIPLGYSLGSDSGGFVSLRFQARGEAEIGAVNAYRGITQGAWRVAPAAR